MSKQLQQLAADNPDVIQDWYRDKDGYWLMLYYGWWCPEMECGTIHEYTVREVLAMFRTVERCPAECIA